VEGPNLVALHASRANALHNRVAVLGSGFFFYPHQQTSNRVEGNARRIRRGLHRHALDEHMGDLRALARGGQRE